MSIQSLLRTAYDGQIESLSKHQQLHSNVQRYGPLDNSVYCFVKREGVRERVKKLGMTGFPPYLQLESRLGWMFLTFKVRGHLSRQTSAAVDQ